MKPVMPRVVLLAGVLALLLAGPVPCSVVQVFDRVQVGPLAKALGEKTRPGAQQVSPRTSIDYLRR